MGGQNPEAWPVNFSKTKVGWTTGLGSELKLTEDVSMKFEYLYVDLGKTTLSSNGPRGDDGPVTYRFKNRFHHTSCGFKLGILI